MKESAQIKIFKKEFYLSKPKYPLIHFKRMFKILGFKDVRIMKFEKLKFFIHMIMMKIIKRWMQILLKKRLF